jgi:hypothetical protein
MIPKSRHVIPLQELTLWPEYTTMVARTGYVKEPLTSGLSSVCIKSKRNTIPGTMAGRNKIHIDWNI